MYLTGCLRSPEVKPAGSVWLSSTRSRQRARPATFVSEIGLKMFCRDSPPLRPVSLFLCCRRSGNLPQNNFFNSRSAFVRKAPDMYLTGWIKPVTHAYYGSAERSCNMTDHERMKTKIVQIENMKYSELSAMFAEFFPGATCPIHPRTLRNRLIYRIQEMHLGGVSQSDRQLLLEISSSRKLHCQSEEQWLDLSAGTLR